MTRLSFSNTLRTLPSGPHNCSLPSLPATSSKPLPPLKSTKPLAASLAASSVAKLFDRSALTPPSSLAGRMRTPSLVTAGRNIITKSPRTISSAFGGRLTMVVTAVILLVWVTFKVALLFLGSSTTSAVEPLGKTRNSAPTPIPAIGAPAIFMLSPRLDTSQPLTVLGFLAPRKGRSRSP